MESSLHSGSDFVISSANCFIQSFIYQIENRCVNYWITFAQGGGNSNTCNIGSCNKQYSASYSQA